MDCNDISDAEEIVDGPQPYNYEPARLPREQGQARINVRQNILELTITETKL